METQDPNVYPTILGGVSRGFWTPFLDGGAQTAIFWQVKTGTFGASHSRGKIIEKIIESPYISIFLIIGKNIGIGLRHPQIIGDFKKLSPKLSISKLPGKLSKNYRY